MKNNNKNLNPVSFRASDELLEKIDKYCEKWGTSRSSLICMILSIYLDNTEALIALSRLTEEGGDLYGKK